MGYYLLINKSLVILIDLLSLWLGAWVYFTAPKNKINRMFVLLSASVILWITFYYFAISASRLSSALLWSRLATGAVALFYIPFYLFPVFFLHLEKKFRHLTKLVLGLGFSLFTLSVFSPFIIEKAVFKNQKLELIFGPGHVVYFLTAVFLSIFVILLFLSRYLNSSAKMKLKMQYFLSGIFIWVFLNFVFNMVFPLVEKTIQYSCFGNYSVIFFLGFTAFAIVKQKLFGIKVIIVELLVGLMIITLLIFTFLMPTLELKTASIVVFLVFLLLSYYLIKSVLKEIELRNKLQKLTNTLEEKVKERTKELEKAKNAAERRTREVEKRKEELERFYNLTINRELRMAELKKKIKELERKMEND